MSHGGDLRSGEPLIGGNQNMLSTKAQNCVNVSQKLEIEITY